MENGTRRIGNRKYAGMTNEKHIPNQYPHPIILMLKFSFASFEE